MAVAASLGIGAAQAQTPVWLNPGVYSLHFERDKELRDDNIGFGTEAVLAPNHAAIAGSFINSNRARSRYAAYAWRPLHRRLGRSEAGFGVVFSAFDGYQNHRNGNLFLAPFPLLAIESKGLGQSESNSNRARSDPRHHRRPVQGAGMVKRVALLFAVLAAVTGMLVAAGSHLYQFLALDQPVGAPVLVIEGWLDPQGLDQAAVAFREGGYRRAVTTGAPIEQWPGVKGYATFAERAAAYLKAKGIAEVTAVPSPESAQDRTFLSAVIVRDWARRTGVEMHAVDVYSQGAHARRSRLLYQLAFGPDVQVGVIAARTSPDLRQWWRTPMGARAVLDQAIALAWTKLFFWPPPPGSHEERWAQPPARQRPRE